VTSSDRFVYHNVNLASIIENKEHLIILEPIDSKSLEYFVTSVGTQLNSEIASP
jgi:hypothetical protein